MPIRAVKPSYEEPMRPKSHTQPAIKVNLKIEAISKVIRKRNKDINNGL